MRTEAIRQVETDTRHGWPEPTVLVHDYLNQFGGAERVLESLHELAPTAPVVTSMYAPAQMPAHYRTWDIRPLWIDQLPGAHRRHQELVPLYPVAFQRARLPHCRLVLSSSSAFAKMVKPPSGATHVSYIHSPMRFAWDLAGYVRRERLPAASSAILRPLMALMRRQDRSTLNRVDVLIANSTAVQARIRAFWRRDATVIFPPVDVGRFRPVSPSQVEPYLLMVSRLVPYKRFDLAIAAANALHLPLWIVGEGRDRAALERMAGPTVRFLGKVSDDELARLYAHCRAAVFASEDDFGIAQVEAQAAGRPVVAYAAGGAYDTVVPNRTGVVFQEQTTESLVDALRRLDDIAFDPSVLVMNAERFSTARFQDEISAVVRQALESRRCEASRPWS